MTNELKELLNVALHNPVVTKETVRLVYEENFMDEEKKMALEEAGHRVGTTDDFLGPIPERKTALIKLREPIKFVPSVQRENFSNKKDYQNAAMKEFVPWYIEQHSQTLQDLINLGLELISIVFMHLVVEGLPEHYEAAKQHPLVESVVFSEDEQ